MVTGSASETPPGHLGLLTMRERAARVGGTFKIESLPEQGTRIRVWIPSDPLWVARRPRDPRVTHRIVSHEKAVLLIGESTDEQHRTVSAGAEARAMSTR